MAKIHKPRQRRTVKINTKPSISRDSFKDVSSFSEKTKNHDIKNKGPGKRGKIFYHIPKDNVRVKQGDIILEYDGLYIVSNVRLPSCPAVRTATILCDSFDPKKLSTSKVLVPKFLPGKKH